MPRAYHCPDCDEDYRRGDGTHCPDCAACDEDYGHQDCQYPTDR